MLQSCCAINQPLKEAEGQEGVGRGWQSSLETISRAMQPAPPNAKMEHNWSYLTMWSRCLKRSFLSPYLFHLHMTRGSAWRRPTKLDAWPHLAEAEQIKENEKQRPFCWILKRISSIQDSFQGQDFADGDVQIKAGHSTAYGISFSSIVQVLYKY